MPPTSPRPPDPVWAVGSLGMSQSRKAWFERDCNHTLPRPENSLTSPSPEISKLNIPETLRTLGFTPQRRVWTP